MKLLVESHLNRLSPVASEKRENDRISSMKKCKQLTEQNESDKLDNDNETNKESDCLIKEIEGF